MRYGAILMENVTQYRTVALEWINSLTGAMLGRGADPTTAHLQALNLIGREVRRQAMMLSFNHVFFLVAVLFLLSFPLIFLLKEGRPPMEDVSTSVEG